jgi:hypothetical protein
MPTDRSGYIDKDGKFVPHPGAEMPRTVPFERGD